MIGGEFDQKQSVFRHAFETSAVPFVAQLAESAGALGSPQSLAGSSDRGQRTLADRRAIGRDWRQNGHRASSFGDNGRAASLRRFKKFGKPIPELLLRPCARSCPLPPPTCELYGAVRDSSSSGSFRPPTDRSLPSHRRRFGRARPERALHHDRVRPVAEFIADRAADSRPGGSRNFSCSLSDASFAASI